MPHVSPITIFLSDPELRINRQRGHFVVRKKHGLQRKIPIIKIGMIIMKCGVTISMDALASLMSKEIPLIYLDEHGRLLGYLKSAARHDASIRLKQFDATRIEKFRFSVAQNLISPKIRNIINATDQFQLSSRAEKRVDEIKIELRKTLRALSKAENTEILRLLSERTDWDYYEILKTVIPPRWGFESRNSGEWPKDPINALLSFLEILVIQEMRGIMECEGLDPGLGFYLDSSSQSLPLPLELGGPLLPGIVGRLTVKLVRKRLVQPDDFTKPNWMDDGIHLTSEGQKKIFTEYEKIMMDASDGSKGEDISSGRAILREQVDTFKRALLSDSLEEWEPCEFGR